METNEMLAVLYQQGDLSAGERLYVNNKKFIWMIIHQLIKSYDGNRLQGDMLQIGAMTLLETAKDFDTSKNTKLLTIAGIRIKEQLMLFLAGNANCLAIPIHRYKMLRRIAYFYNLFEDKEHGERVKLLSGKFQLSTKVTEELIAEALTFGGFLEIRQCESFEYKSNTADETQPPHVIVYKKLCHEFLQELIDNTILSDMQKDILVNYYGLNGMRAVTFEEISELYCLTASGCEKAHKEAIKKLKENLNGSKLKLWREIYWTVMNIRI